MAYGHTVNVSVCAICDRDRDPLDVPAEACGHGPTHARLVSVPVIPLRVTEDMVRRAAQALADDNGGLAAVDWRDFEHQARTALAAAFNTTEEQKP